VVHVENNAIAMRCIILLLVVGAKRKRMRGCALQSDTSHMRVSNPSLALPANTSHFQHYTGFAAMSSPARRSSLGA
jgi:hypothetical protein